MRMIAAIIYLLPLVCAALEHSSKCGIIQPYCHNILGTFLCTVFATFLETVTKRSELLSAQFMASTTTPCPCPIAFPRQILPRPTNPISLWKTCAELKVDLPQLQQRTNYGECHGKHSMQFHSVLGPGCPSSSIRRSLCTWRTAGNAREASQAEKLQRQRVQLELRYMCI